jgi:hypothetical protein
MSQMTPQECLERANWPRVSASQMDTHKGTLMLDIRGEGWASRSRWPLGSSSQRATTHTWRGQKHTKEPLDLQFQEQSCLSSTKDGEEQFWNTKEVECLDEPIGHSIFCLFSKFFLIWSHVLEIVSLSEIFLEYKDFLTFKNRFCSF